MQRKKQIPNLFLHHFPVYSENTIKSISVKGTAKTFPVDMVLATCHFIHELLNEQI